MTAAPVRWGILGPGRIARDFFAAAAGSAGGRVVAIGSRDPDRPDLAAAFPGVRRLAGYDALLADPAVEAVYVATPHPFHARWAVAAARAGKHVLCEKPLGMTEAEVRLMVDAARAAGTFLGEAYMYRFHPLTARLVELVRAGAVGEVRMIRSSFGFAAPFDPAHRLFAPALGGGAILDVGGYPVTMASLIAGCRTPAGWSRAEQVRAVAHVGATGVEEWAAAVIRYPGGVVADLSCSIAVEQDNVLHVMGSAGRLKVDRFWFAGGKGGGTAAIRVVGPDGAREVVAVTDPRPLYRFELEAASRAIRAGAGGFAWPGLDAEQSIATAQVLDRWRAEAGVAGPPAR